MEMREGAVVEVDEIYRDDDGGAPRYWWDTDSINKMPAPVPGIIRQIGAPAGPVGLSMRLLPDAAEHLQHGRRSVIQYLIWGEGRLWTARGEAWIAVNGHGVLRVFGGGPRHEPGELTVGTTRHRGHCLAEILASTLPGLLVHVSLAPGPDGQ